MAKVLKLDRRSVYKAYRDWPGLARRGFEARFDLPAGGFSRAFVLGMGGSAAGGDLVAGWLKPLGRPELTVCKGWIPASDMRGTLAIACSASGRTSETIKMMKTALGKGAKVVSISSGGRLKEEASRLGVGHIMMPEVIAPRYMLPFIAFSCLAVLNRAFRLHCEREAEEAIGEMGRQLPAIDAESPTQRNPAKRLARRILPRTPVAFADGVAQGVATRFKTTVNENAKLHAISDTVPEIFHNEVQAWEDPAHAFVPVFLRHDWEEPAFGRKVDAFSKILRSRGHRPETVEGKGTGRLSQLVTMTFLLDMASYYMAIALGRDPVTTHTIDALKKV